MIKKKGQEESRREEVRKKGAYGVAIWVDKTKSRRRQAVDASEITLNCAGSFLFLT